MLILILLVFLVTISIFLLMITLQEGVRIKTYNNITIITYRTNVVAITITDQRSVYLYLPKYMQETTIRSWDEREL